MALDGIRVVASAALVRVISQQRLAEASLHCARLTCD